jgi:hypothetical protein
MARAAMSGVNALPCQSFLSSNSGTPLAFTVPAKIMLGRSGSDLASVSARSMAARSWPSMTIGRAPKASTRWV